MILGQSRTPYHTPAAAIPGFQPKLPRTGFYSHFHPLTLVTHAMVSAPGMYRPPLEPAMGPHALPDVPLPAPAAAPVAPALPKPGGVSGFGFGSTGGVQHSHVSAYRTMRNGFIAPGTMPSGANIRAGVRNAGDRVQRMFPFQTAPLPPPPPPPAPPVPAAAATHGFGRAGGWRHAGHPAMGMRKRRNWLSRMWAPETVHEIAAQTPTCEWVTDSVSGISKQICDGHVVAYKDAQGNVIRPGDYA
jgi:hypothetical protein